MICPNCGTENRPGASFCTGCGNSLDTKTAVIPEHEWPDYSAPSGEESSFALIARDGTRHPIIGPTTTIGREGCDILLPQDGLISRKHAEIRRHGDELVLTDLDSSNGTFVNGSRLRAPQTLCTGDTIQVGSTKLTLQGAGGAPPTRSISEPPPMTSLAPSPRPHAQPMPTHGAPAGDLSYVEKPGQVQTIAIMCIIDGILNILWAISLAGGLIATLVGALCVPVALYPLVLGIIELIYGFRLSSDHPQVEKPAQYLAIMQIANILVGDVISLIIGIISLVFYNDSRVQAYFASIATSHSRKEG